MKAVRAGLAVLLALTPLLAASQSVKDGTSRPLADDGSNRSAADDGGLERRFRPPAEAEIPNDAFGELVRRGRAIFVNTPGQAPEYVGNGMSCTNCHLEQGRLANSAPLWGAYTLYPAYREKNKRVNSYAERLQDCFEFSMNGKPSPLEGEVISALTAFSYWMARGAPTGQALPGRGYPEVVQPAGGYDISKGRQVYATKCAICHGDEGQGQKVGDAYVFPPLWGKDSYNWGAGMHRINTAAAFIQANMPLGQRQQPERRGCLERCRFHEQPGATAGPSTRGGVRREDAPEVPRR